MLNNSIKYIKGCSSMAHESVNYLDLSIRYGQLIGYAEETVPQLSKDIADTATDAALDEYGVMTTEAGVYAVDLASISTPDIGVAYERVEERSGTNYDELGKAMLAPCVILKELEDLALKIADLEVRERRMAAQGLVGRTSHTLTSEHLTNVRAKLIVRESDFDAYNLRRDLDNRIDSITFATPLPVSFISAEITDANMPVLSEARNSSTTRIDTSAEAVGPIEDMLVSDADFEIVGNFIKEHTSLMKKLGIELFSDENRQCRNRFTQTTTETNNKDGNALEVSTDEIILARQLAFTKIARLYVKLKPEELDSIEQLQNEELKNFVYQMNVMDNAQLEMIVDQVIPQTARSSKTTAVSTGKHITGGVSTSMQESVKIIIQDGAIRYFSRQVNGEQGEWKEDISEPITRIDFDPPEIVDQTINKPVLVTEAELRSESNEAISARFDEVVNAALEKLGVMFAEDAVQFIASVSNMIRGSVTRETVAKLRSKLQSSGGLMTPETISRFEAVYLEAHANLDETDQKAVDKRKLAIFVKSVIDNIQEYDSRKKELTRTKK
jgi:hypothetical protein